MQLIGFLRKLQSRLTIHGNQRNIPVHMHAILRIEMQIQLFHLPRAILISDLRQIRRILGMLHAMLHDVGADLMRTMTILSINIMRDHDVRLILT